MLVGNSFHGLESSVESFRSMLRGSNFLLRRIKLTCCSAVPAALGGFLCVPAMASTGLDDAPPTDYQKALTCLTQAISFEAGNEPIEGQEAVAQVILNRVRHQAYPSTVCGVVYQGSTRKTGCQFTFTCDGSLRRGRSQASLLRSQIVAERVLAGKASTLVGGATHYHADYVSPYWAPSLVKVAKIGLHVFYRMPGAPDSPAIVSVANLINEPYVADTVVSLAGSTQQIKSLTRAVVSTSASVSSSAFAPWGLPVLVVGKNGKIQAVTQ